MTQKRKKRKLSDGEFNNLTSHFLERETDFELESISHNEDLLHIGLDSIDVEGLIFALQKATNDINGTTRRLIMSDAITINSLRAQFCNNEV